MQTSKFARYFVLSGDVSFCSESRQLSKNRPGQNRLNSFFSIDSNWMRNCLSLIRISFKTSPVKMRLSNN
jgi:hypothetical protein